MNRKILVYLKNMSLEESTVVFLQIIRIIMQLRPQNVILRWDHIVIRVDDVVRLERFG